MTEKMEKFLEQISSEDQSYFDRLNHAEQDEIIQMAAEKGVRLTDADFEETEGEVSLDEAEAVAGGKKCYCVAGGGGSEEGIVDRNTNRDWTCACVGVGSGRYWDGRQKKSIERCFCVGYGSGASHV